MKFLHVVLLRRERLKAIYRRSLSEVYSLAHHLFAASPLPRLAKRYGKGAVKNAMARLRQALERVNSFKEHSAAASWIARQSEPWWVDRWISRDLLSREDAIRVKPP